MKIYQTANTARITKKTSRGLTTGLGLVILMLIWGTAVSAETSRSNGLPEFELPSYDVEAFGTELDLPNPVKIVKPIVGMSLTGAQVTMSFRISKKGYVENIRNNASQFDARQINLASVMSCYLGVWKFEPARDAEGNAVAVKVSMPVKVVSGGNGGRERYARLALERSTIVAVAR